MADRARKKQQQRLKRERKRLALRKARGGGGAVSPVRQHAGGELVACYMNDDWRERGQAVAFVLRRGRDGRLAMATFMVDLWCAGLKDAWGRVGLTRDEFEDAVERMSDSLDDTVGDAPLADVAAVVAGGIRFARRNGFRLPHHYDRWAAFLGELQPASADLTHFGVEGGTKLRWVGPMHDLRARLIGSPVEEFLARPDVEFITEVGPFDAFGPADDFALDQDDDDDDDDEGDEDEDLLGPAEEMEQTFELLDSMVEQGTASVRRWCFANGLVPEEKIAEALPLVIARGIAGVTDNPADEYDDSNASVAAAVARIHEQTEEFLESLPEPERLRLEAAILQVSQFVRATPNPRDFVAAFGLAKTRTRNEA